PDSSGANLRTNSGASAATRTTTASCIEDAKCKNPPKEVEKIRQKSKRKPVPTAETQKRQGKKKAGTSGFAKWFGLQDEPEQSQDEPEKTQAKPQ
ncbi:hypothetical protein Tco_1139347, partial [Tanacetum coccineum]